MKKEILHEIIKLRQELHKIPELSFAEEKTKELLMDWIRKNTDLEIVDRGFWFYAYYQGVLDAESDSLSLVSSGTDKERKFTSPIAFRADFDAVEGADGMPGHYCGHDGHAAILAGLAKVISEKEPERSVYLIFQPAEETGEGALLCRDLLKEKKISEIYGFHNIPGYERGSVLLLPGTFACASTGLEISFIGSPTHAAYPDLGKNPCDAIAELVLMRKELLHMPHQGLLQATVIGSDLGSQAYGVSASSGVLRLTLRGEIEEEFQELVRTFIEASEDLARRDGLEVETALIETFPATMNNKACVDKIRMIAEELGLTTVTPEEPFRWSEDFGYYLQWTDGALFGIGSGVDYAPLHTRDYEFPDEIIETVIKLYESIILYGDK